MFFAFIIGLWKAIVSHFDILHSLSKLNDYENRLFHLKVQISNINSTYITTRQRKWFWINSTTS